MIDCLFILIGVQLYESVVKWTYLNRGENVINQRFVISLCRYIYLGNLLAMDSGGVTYLLTKILLVLISFGPPPDEPFCTLQ